LEEVEIRSTSAYRELQTAWRFQYVIPNHDGEDSENWEAFYYLIGDARKTLDSFVALLNGVAPPGVEKWGKDLFLVESASSYS
jgi:guanylate kinase